jgi:hypothetical protein
VRCELGGSVKDSAHDRGLDDHAAGFRPGEEISTDTGNPRWTFRDYGPNFATGLQLYAAAGYIVLYTNPRGSTSYGEQFLVIHHAYRATTTTISCRAWMR